MNNALTLAYIGDAVYEVYIRNHFIQKGIVKVKELQREVVSYVSAKGQASFLTKMIDENYLTPEELDIVMRARNHKSDRHPKYTDIITYKYATGLEALIGYLFLNGKVERLETIIKFIIGE